jgi:phospholipid/cholesterol/gamma-HCH transport system substrate-binding protein
MTPEEKTAVRVGAAVLAALAVAAAALLALEGRHLRPGVRLSVEMDRIGNLQAGAAVKLAGLTLGTVDEIQLVPAPPGADDPVHALLLVWIDARHRHLVRETTDFFINQEGLLGDSYLGIAERPGEPGPPLPEGARVRGVAPPQIDKLLATSYRNLQAATQLLRDGMPEMDELAAALDELELTLDAIGPAEGSWAAGARLALEARLLSDGVSREALAALAGRDPGLGKARALAPRLRALSATANRIAARLDDPRAQRLAAAIDGAARLAAGAEQAVATARSLVALVARGQGSLGAFLQDVELADEMKEMTRTMKRQPWVTIGRPGR